MKAIVLTLGLLMASSAVIADDNDKKRSGDHDARRAQIQKELDLSSEQIEQMREIREQGGSREDVQAILTEEQQAKAAKIREKHKGDKGERINRMKEHLDLTDEQVEQMKEIREDGGSREDIHAVLTDEQKAKIEKAKTKHGEKNKGKESGKSKY